MKEAEEEWARFAEEIKQGKRKSFVELLEERGLLHQVVGLVNFWLLLAQSDSASFIGL
jgi:hypothetical protein